MESKNILNSELMICNSNNTIYFSLSKNIIKSTTLVSNQQPQLATPLIFFAVDLTDPQSANCYCQPQFAFLRSQSTEATLNMKIKLTLLVKLNYSHHIHAYCTILKSIIVQMYNMHGCDGCSVTSQEGNQAQLVTYSIVF